ncbi:hypothetical protein [Sphaerisporangium sp. NPDC051011]|uniref:hypothetical protein n=1 Tax=Sphaerisporangium sp. NPDC051011 TaxID=3155792 RepID=UPI0033F3BAEE
MAGGLKVAVAVALGYFLGRHRRFKLAIALAVAGATGRLGGTRGNLLEQGMKLVSSSPELEKIVNSVRGELFEAGKAAASRQVSSISAKLQARAESLQHAANGAAGLEETATGAATEAATGATATATGAARGAARTARGGVSGLRHRATGGYRTARARRPRGEEEGPYEDQYGEYAEYEEEEDYEEPPPRGPAREGARRARDVGPEDVEE